MSRRTKRRICKALTWGGLLCVFASFFLLPCREVLGWCLLAAGGFISLIGALTGGQYYRCPRCGKDLLSAGSRLDALWYKPPHYCPNCGLEIPKDFKDD